MDVHKDSVMIAVLPEGVREPTVVKRLSHDPRGIRRMLDRLAREHEVRACYEVSGAGPEEQSDRSGGGGQGTGRVRVGSQAGERGRDRSRAARRLRSIDQGQYTADAEKGRSPEARQENARASYVAGAETGLETHAT